MLQAPMPDQTSLVFAAQGLQAISSLQKPVSRKMFMSGGLYTPPFSLNNETETFTPQTSALPDTQGLQTIPSLEKPVSRQTLGSGGAK